MWRTLPPPIRGRGRSLASMVFIVEGFNSRVVARTRGRKEMWAVSLRKRNELGLIGDMRETAALPVLLGLLDPLFAGGNEIPPDVARAFERVAAEKHHPHRFRRLYCDAIAGPKDQQPRPLIAIAGYFDLAIDQVDGAFFVVGIERHADALLRGHLGIKPWRHHLNRRRGAERAACDNPGGKTAIVHRR